MNRTKITTIFIITLLTVVLNGCNIPIPLLAAVPAAPALEVTEQTSSAAPMLAPVYPVISNTPQIASVPKVLAQSITLNTTDATIQRTQKLKLTATIAPGEATSKKVKWKSSNARVASVSSSGVVTGKKAGTAVITCTAKDGSGAVASCTITVLAIDPSSVKLSKTALTLKPNKTATIKATVAPKNADYKTVTWASDNPAIATVTSKGKIKGIAEGTATITATSSNGIVTACTVTVSCIYPTSLKMSKTAVTLKAGKTYTLRATIAPRNTDFKAVTWASDNPAVATVTNKGKVKAIAGGTATITAVTANGIAASCVITVPGALPPAPPPVDVIERADSAYLNEVLRGINACRDEEGVPHLTLVGDINDYAYQMAESQDIYHGEWPKMAFESVVRTGDRNGYGQGVVSAVHVGNIASDAALTSCKIGVCFRGENAYVIVQAG